MTYVTYDKAKWHWGAKNAPTDIPQENGATHIAFFFRWCMERKLYSKDFAADFADDIARMDDSFDYRGYFFGAMDGVLGSDELNRRQGLCKGLLHHGPHEICQNARLVFARLRRFRRAKIRR